jgi:protein-disulfide isomerase
MPIDPGRFVRGLLLVAGIGVAVVSGLAAKAHGVTTEPVAPAMLEPVRGEDPGISLGPIDAAHVIRIFGDYECPACMKLEAESGDGLRNLARSGRLRFVYVHAPLETHRRGPLAARLVHCAAQHADPWPLHRALYRSSGGWGRGPEPEQVFRVLVEASVPDPALILDCYHGSVTEELTTKEIELSRGLGIDRVPTVWIGDRQVVNPSARRIMRIVRTRMPRSTGLE